MAKTYLDINKLDYKKLIRRKDIKELSSGFVIPSSVDLDGHFGIMTNYGIQQAILGRMQKRSELLIWILIDWGYHPDDHPKVHEVLLDLGVWTPMSL